MTPLLLDTCALIWAANGGDRAGPLRSLLERARRQAAELWVSPISAWEIGNIARRNRLGSTLPALVWFETAVARGGLRQTGLGARELVASTELPGTLHRDPADRIIIATAREMKLTVVTGDRLILDYADKGHVQAMAC